MSVTIDHPLPPGLAGGNLTLTINGVSVHGNLTAHHSGPHAAGAFVVEPPVYIPGPPARRFGKHRMYYARFGKVVEPGHLVEGTTIIIGQTREVVEVRRVTRDEFDRLTGLDRLRRDLGWRDYE